MTDLRQPATTRRRADQPPRRRSIGRRAARAVRPALGEPVTWVGLVLVIGATAYRTWALDRTWFYLDDFNIVNTTLLAGSGSLTEPYIGHLMPGGRALGWLTAAGGTFDYTIAVIEIVALFALAGIGFLRLLRTLFGARPAILVPLTFFLLNPWLTSVTLWWAAAINHLPALIATAFALNAHVWLLRTGRRRHLVAALAWIVAGLAFAELALLALVPIAFVTVAYFTTGSAADRLRQVWSRDRAAGLAYATVAAAYLGLYVSVGGSDTLGGEVRIVDYVVNLFGDVVTSTFIGGPGRWDSTWAAGSYADPTDLVRIVGTVAVGTVVGLSALTRDRAMRAWLLPLAVLGCCLALTIWGRRAFGPGLILELRFTAPAVLSVALAIGLAFLPVRGAAESSSPRDANPLVDRWQPVALATVGFVVFAVMTANAFPLRHLPAGSHPEDFFATFERSLADHPDPVPLVSEGALPGYVAGGPEAAFPIGLALFRDRLTYPTVTHDGELYTVDTDGNIVPADLDVSRIMAPAPDGASGRGSTCEGYAVDSRGRDVRLTGPVFGFGWRIRISYEASSDTPAVIRFGDDEVETTLQSGEHSLELPAPGAYDRVSLAGISPGTDVCVTQVKVGQSVPASD